MIITADEHAALLLEASQRVGLRSPVLYEGCKEKPATYARPRCLGDWPQDWPLIPREEWPNEIAEGQDRFLGDLTRPVLPVHYQNGRNRCWAHGSVRAVEVLRVWTGLVPRILSADSVAYPVEGDRDRGGYAEDACEVLATRGACDQSLWPNNDLTPYRAASVWQADALGHLILRWVQVPSFDHLMTCLFRRIPVALPCPWWRHLVCATSPKQLGKRSFGVEIDNSWGADWKDQGRATLDEESAQPGSGAFAPYSVVFGDFHRKVDRMSYQELATH